MNADCPRVSVVVCTRDRPTDAQRCVASILANDYPDFELLVIDQSASDETASLLKDLGDSRVVVVRRPVAGKARAENHALGCSTGELIAFTDDDCTVPSTWLQRAVHVLQDEPAAAMVFGALAAAPHDPVQVFIPTFQPPTRRLIRGPIFRFARDAGLGANVVARRTVFERLGCFDEWVGPGSPFRSGDDHDLAYRSLRAGLVLLQDPENVVVHWGARDWASGAAARTINNNFYGIGAYYARQLRRGDWVGAYLLVRQILWLLESSLPDMVHGRKAPPVRRLAAIALGAARGFLAPPGLRWPSEQEAHPSTS